MEEAEYLCDEIAIINKGKILATDTPGGLKQKHGGMKTVEIKLKNPGAGSVADMLKPLVSNRAAVETPSEDTIRINSSEAQELLVKIIESFSKAGVQIESVSVNPPTLEEVFLSVVGNGAKS
jgi:ABC-2 type transport system ATP-binding protein